MKRLRTLRVVGIAALTALLGAFGYYSSMHTSDVGIYRAVGEQLLQRNYEIYSAVADGGFRYAPITALIFVPLALVPLPVGAAAIFLLKICGLLCSCLFTMKMLQLDPGHPCKRCGLAALCVAGFLIEEFRSGNIHFLVFVLIVIALFQVERGRTALPAVLLALSIALKLTPFLFVVYFGMKRRFLLCIETMIVLALLFLLPGPFVGIETNGKLIRAFTDSAAQKFDESRNHSLRGVLLRFLSETPDPSRHFPAVSVAALSPGTIEEIWYALCAAGMIGTAAIIGFRRRDHIGRALEYSLVFVAILILSPHSLRIYFSTLYFPVLILMGLTRPAAAFFDRRAIHVLLWTVFVIGTLIPLVLPGRNFSLAYEAYSPPFALALIVFAMLSALLRQNSRTTPGFANT